MKYGFDPSMLVLKTSCQAHTNQSSFKTYQIMYNLKDYPKHRYLKLVFIIVLFEDFLYM